MTVPYYICLMNACKIYLDSEKLLAIGVLMGGQPERILKGLCWIFSICPSGSTLHPPFLWPLLQKADLHAPYPSGYLAVWLLLDLANEDTSRRGES